MCEVDFEGPATVTKIELHFSDLWDTYGSV